MFYRQVTIALRGISATAAPNSPGRWQWDDHYRRRCQRNFKTVPYRDLGTVDALMKLLRTVSTQAWALPSPSC